MWHTVFFEKKERVSSFIYSIIFNMYTQLGWRRTTKTEGLDVLWFFFKHEYGGGDQQLSSS